MSADALPPDRVVEVLNPTGAGEFILVCEHASNFIPDELKNLGLEGDVLQSHIAWDPGAFLVAQAMSVELDAPLIVPRISRLVYDCNRPPSAQSAVATESEVSEIPGNVGLSAEDRQARVSRFYEPFRDTLNANVQHKLARGSNPILVTVHSFTSVFKGVSRDLDIGILHDVDSRLADALIKIFAEESALIVRRNEPYGPEDGVTYTLTEHALPYGLPNVMIEIRNDLIDSLSSQQSMAEKLSKYLVKAGAVY